MRRTKSAAGAGRSRGGYAQRTNQAAQSTTQTPERKEKAESRLAYTIKQQNYFTSTQYIEFLVHVILMYNAMIFQF